ncbi:hypothetical protein MHUMG1_05455 [Metarhizium humberi]|uniref:prephenate dehydratase n=1 Tax=Metarhizium humberi TaxID=2596975 RepID=A0A9P8MEK9_9HYPO|nr:hypothetical protein MHUMG1_05455 [Metarhizium humberi]
MASHNEPVVSFLGPVASYSHQAVRQVFPEDKWDLRPVNTIDDVFDEVQDRRVTAGVVPFENSTNGSVVFTLDNLADRNGRYKDITVDGEIFVDVHHCLLGRKSPNDKLDETHEASGTCTPTATHPSPPKPKSKPLTSLSHIKRLYSHPQAFGQCNAFISTYLKGVEIIDVSSTSKAAEIVSQDETGTWAAISNHLALSLYGLDLLGKNIEDREDNTTRFLVIGTNPSVPDDWDLQKLSIAKSGSKSLVSFTVPHTSPGALADVLGCFREFNLNLTSINSRPSLLAPFQYIFFVEFAGHKYDDPDGRASALFGFVIFTKMAVVDLESREHRDLLDLIDKLRSKGINQYVALPEIVVTGDQSAGKSSVLEAISGMSFPTKDSLCTRFATELILRRSSSVGVKISILPAACRPMPEQEKLKRFRPVVEQGSLELSHVVEQAKLVMGITPTSKAFRNDILRVEISGPSQPHLTMVDLPGLFQAGNSVQSDEDSETVTNIALRYMERPRSIILAVVSAKSDFALQQVTRLARRLDPEGRRTVGLITKPDTLDEGSESEAAYIRLAQNEDVRFKLGWHVLKNRDYKMTLNKATSQERDDAEREFFSKGPWAALDPSIVGVKAIFSKTKYFFNCQTCQAFSDLMKAAVDGFYNDPFFGSSKSEEGYQKRLRAVVQGLLIDFKDNMNELGCTRHIVDSDDESDDEDMTLSGNKVLRSAYVEEVGELMNRNRGCELPGTFNPLIVGDLFFEQCKPWEDITEILFKKVLESVKRVAHEIIAHVTVESTAAKLGRFIRPAIQVLAQELEASFLNLLKPYQKIHSITYNEALTENVQKAQAERRRRKIEARLTKAYPIEMYGAQRLTVTRQAILEIFTAEEDVNMKLYGSSLAVDYLQAYYNVSLKKFIDDISTLGVECCLIQKLRSLFEPRYIYKMSDTEIQHLAEEDPATKLERSRLREKLNILDGCLTKVIQNVDK